MTDLTPRTTASAAYLARLRTAVAGLPDGDDIIRGVAEELSGLDESTTRERIATLGDPERIALAARGASPAPAAIRTVDVILPTLAMIFGGVILPVIGSIAGVVLAGISRVWTRTEKLIAVIAPLAVTALIALVALISGLVSPPQASVDNPLMPATYDVVWSVVATWVVLTAAAGVWLLVRGLPRRS